MEVSAARSQDGFMHDNDLAFNVQFDFVVQICAGFVRAGFETCPGQISFVRRGGHFFGRLSEGIVSDMPALFLT